jgi:LEA14-like dessication related protein
MIATSKGISRFMILLALALLPLAGCATMSPSLEAPRINLVDLRPQPAKGLETAFDLQLRLINPNDVALKIKGIDCRLELNEATIVSGVSNRAVELPALGTIVYPVTAYSSASNFIFLFLRLVASGNRSPDDLELNYSLQGRVFLADGVPGLNRLSFKSEGDLLKLIQPPPKSSSP